MKKPILIISVVLLLICFAFIDHAFPWAEETHGYLSEYASENSVLSKDKGDYLKNLGFEKGLIEKFKFNGIELDVKKWLSRGANLEDASSFGFPFMPYSTTRSFNHFHNPLKFWGEAGLNDTWTGLSSLIWAQAGSLQNLLPEGDQSWQTIRLFYYNALTGKTDTKRQEYFARTFKGLGHQMHLIQDAGQPDHVRNDAHPEDSVLQTRPIVGGFYFETWAKRRIRNLTALKTFVPTPISPMVSFDLSYLGLAPITQLIDTDQYYGANPSTSTGLGISEYTNANYFSDDTIFAAERYSSDHKHYFPYPKKSSTDLQSYINQSKLPETVQGIDNIPDTSFWIKKNADGEKIDYFLKPSYLSLNLFAVAGESTLYYRTFYIDDECHKAYAKELLPRAVGYSAGLLNYFFRGEMDMIPDDVKGSGYVIVNNTDEDMSGTFELWYDNDKDERTKVTNASWTLSISKKSSGHNKSTNITFTPPDNAKEPGKYMLVFRGKLGNEDDAVAGKEIDLKETYIFLVDIKGQNFLTLKLIAKKDTYNLQAVSSDSVKRATEWEHPSTLLIVQSHPNKKEHRLALPWYHSYYKPDISKYGGSDTIGSPYAYIPKDFKEGSPYVWNVGLIRGEVVGVYPNNRFAYYIHGRRPFEVVGNKLVANNINIRENNAYTYYGNDYSGPFYIQYRDESGRWVKSLDLPQDTWTEDGERDPAFGDWKWYTSDGTTYTFLAVIDRRKALYLKDRKYRHYTFDGYVKGYEEGDWWVVETRHYKDESGLWEIALMIGDTTLDSLTETYSWGEHSDGLTAYYPKDAPDWGGVTKLRWEGSYSSNSEGRNQYSPFNLSSVTVMDYDNLNGDENLIVFYKIGKSRIDGSRISASEGEWTRNVGSSASCSASAQSTSTSSDHYFLLYKIGSAIHKVPLAAYTSSFSSSSSGSSSDPEECSEGISMTPVTSSSRSGEKITAISCQINDTNMVYTYIVERSSSEESKWVFNKRIVGIINLSDEALPEGYRQEFEITEANADSILGEYKDYNYKDLAAIGVHVGKE